MTSKDIANNMSVPVSAARGLVAFLEECGAMTKVGTKRNNIKSRGKPANDYVVNMEKVGDLFNSAAESLKFTATLPKQVLPTKERVSSSVSHQVTPPSSLDAPTALVVASGQVNPIAPAMEPSWATVDGIPIEEFESASEDDSDNDIEEGEENDDDEEELYDSSPSAEDLNAIEEEEGKDDFDDRRPSFDRDSF